MVGEEKRTRESRRLGILTGGCLLSRMMLISWVRQGVASTGVDDSFPPWRSTTSSLVLLQHEMWQQQEEEEEDEWMGQRQRAIRMLLFRIFVMTVDILKARISYLKKGRKTSVLFSHLLSPPFLSVSRNLSVISK